jgi:probable F420-dependent oxidoreductase
MPDPGAMGDSTMHPVKFNVSLSNSDFATARAMAERAEALGFYSVSLDDHFFMRGLMADPKSPHLECYTTLSAIAGITKRIRLLQMVTSMSYRNPALLAKITSTLDVISGGRLVVGVGAGWFREEYEAYNYPYPSNAERIEQLAEGIKVLKTMWTEDEPTFTGRYFSIKKAYNFPKPIQKPHPPLLVGGSGKRVLEIGSHEADIHNLIPPIKRGFVDLTEALKFDKAELKRRIETLRGFAKAAGRSPDAIEISGQSFVLAARDKSEADAMVQATAQAMGIQDVEAARRSPQVLVGTVEDVKREIRSRIEELGITYFSLEFISPDTVELFADEIMPEFTKR